MRKACLILGWILWASGFAWLVCYGLTGVHYMHVRAHTTVDPVLPPNKEPVPQELVAEIQTAANEVIDSNLRDRISILKPAALILAGTILLVWRPKSSKNEPTQT